MGALAISDRGYRYRANKLAADHPRVCVFCGALPQHRKLMVAHLDGHEENDVADNVAWSCRPCNSIASNTLKNAGLGRLTRQYNPTKSGGAANVGEWINAVGAITPHVDRGDRGLASTMNVSDAVAMIRATPPHKRSEFWSQLRKHQGKRSSDRWNPASKKNIWPFSDAKKRGVIPASGGLAKFAGARAPSKAAVSDRALGSYKGYKVFRTPDGEFFSSLDPDSWYETKAQLQRAIDWYKKGRVNPSEQLLREAQTSRNVQELARLHKHALKTGNGNLLQAVELRAADLGFTHAQLTQEYGWKFNPAKFDRCVKAVQKHGGAVNAYAVCMSAMKKKNPADVAASVYEEFHGHPPSEEITVVKKVHFHKHLASAGELKRLVIKGVDYQRTGRVVTLRRFGGALLAFNEAKNQLFVEGGDQKIDLSDFGIEPKKAHELETLGRVTAIDYKTNKTHLGDEGGEATYEHGFRMTNENGKHIVVKIARYPDLIYSVPDEQLLFSGGSYFIRAEGIDQ